MLDPLGLPSHVAEIYRSMLRQPGCTVNELAASLGWPPELVRSGLDECVRLSLVKPSWGGPENLRAVSPEVALQALLSHQENDLMERHKQLNEARVEIARFIDDHNAAQQDLRSAVIERLNGLEETRSRIEGLTQNCSRELLTFAAAGSHTEESRRASQPLCEALARRGVVMRSVYLDSVHNDPATVEHLCWLHAHGDQVRTAASLPSRMLVFDRAHAVLPIDPDDSAAGALVLHGRGIIVALCELFERVWEEALPFVSGRPQHRERGFGELSPQEQAVLRLLGEGLTDEVVARKLGVSVRTGRRITAELMSRLGARSRFQAGLRAAQLGWLDGPDDLPDYPDLPAKGRARRRITAAAAGGL
ncbi:LuxR C-terminal-related transcriptional regulator [Streptomyces sp. NPDC093252]|uniref:LuxR C-terminal-related transcriptional regulator n=1 Tax=Streptomyces sp. NPDC093252 TaxID=3154980 RepID=UPI00344247A9